MGKLLHEFTDIKSLQIIKEGTEHQREYRIRGPFFQAEIKNNNGRIYPIKYATESINSYCDRLVKTRRALGELEHRNDPSIQMERASHLVESLIIEGNDAIGVAKILGTPMGKIAQVFIDEGVVFGISSRSIGQVDENNIVQPGFEICAFDLVSDPSAPKALMEGICENREWIVGPDGNWRAAENLKKGLDKKFDDDTAMRLLRSFISEVAKKA